MSVVSIANKPLYERLRTVARDILRNPKTTKPSSEFLYTASNMLEIAENSNRHHEKFLRENDLTLKYEKFLVEEIRG